MSLRPSKSRISRETEVWKFTETHRRQLLGYGQTFRQIISFETNVNVHLEIFLRQWGLMRASYHKRNQIQSNGHRYSNGIFTRIFLTANICILNEILLIFFLKAKTTISQHWFRYFQTVLCECHSPQTYWSDIGNNSMMPIFNFELTNQTSFNTYPPQDINYALENIHQIMADRFICSVFKSID